MAKNNNNSGLGSKILMTIAVIGVSLIAPQLPYLILKRYLKEKFKEDYTKSQLVNSINYLKRRKYIAYTNGKYTVTKIGHKQLRLAYTQNLKIPKVAWDHKWRFVSFDIPEEQKSARHALLWKLKHLGFYHFQRSLFVIPYPCDNEIRNLVKTLQITPHVHIFTADRFDSDKNLLKFFKI